MSSSCRSREAITAPSSWTWRSGSAAVDLAGRQPRSLPRGGRTAEAASAEPLLALSRDVEFWPFFTHIQAALGVAHGLAGRVAEGLAALEQAVAHAASTRFQNGLSALLADLAQLYLRAGRHEDATRRSQEALGLARQVGERGNEARALAVHAAAAAEGEAPDRASAEPRFQEALALARALEMRPTEAICHLGLGQLHRRTGQPARARVALARAAESFRGLGMTSWLARAEAALDGR